jgi:hypothetical protein
VCGRPGRLQLYIRLAEAHDYAGTCGSQCTEISGGPVALDERCRKRYGSMVVRLGEDYRKRVVSR